MNIELLRKEINKTNASLFRVSFVKANGEHRTMYLSKRNGIFKEIYYATVRAN